MRSVPKLMSLLLTFSAHAGTVGNGTATSCTEAAFDAALANAKTGETIAFQCGAKQFTLAISTEKFIQTNQLTLDGGGKITLDGQGKTRILKTDSGYTLQSSGGFQFTLKNIALHNGFTTDQGGAFQVGYWNHLRIDNVNFQNNQATRDTQACDGGGALFIGGGSRVAISSSRFVGNKANNGGAINNLRTDLTITDSLFSHNSAMHTTAINQLADCGGGGAIYIDGAKKESEGGGGAGALKIIRSRFTDNSTNHLGGALFSYIHGATTLEIDSSTFYRNTAKSGGAIYHQRTESGTEKATAGALLYLKNSSIVGNGATGELGGGVRVQSPAQIVNSTFSGNWVENSTIPATDVNNWKRGHGGALVAGTGTEIIHSTIANNRAAAWGGAISGSGITLKNSIVANNTGGSGWKIQQNCTANLIDGGGNIQYPARLTSNFNDYECIAALPVANPQLAALGDYGGLTPTLNLQTSSSALRKGVTANCLATDQRGMPRASVCDSGAVEFSSTSPATITTSPAGAVLPSGNSIRPIATSASFKNNILNLSTRQINGSSIRDQDTFSIASTVSVDTAHVGQAAALFVLIGYQANGATQPLWLTRSGSEWQVLGTSFQPTQLAAADTRTALSEVEDIPVLSGILRGIAGKLTVHAGYRLDDGTLVFNVQPLVVTIAP